MKQCNKCFNWKDESEFNKVKLKNTCKGCVHVVSKNWTGKTCICVGCKFEKTHYAKGFCRKCYREKQESDPNYHIPTPSRKICAKCKIDKPSNEFPKHSSTKNG